MSKIKGMYPFQASDAEYFKDVAFLLEATNFEQFMLWEKWFDNVDHREKVGLQSWKQGVGKLVPLGEIGGLPIVISIIWDWLNDSKVIFWESTSQVVDHRMIDAYFAHFAPKIGKSNSSNFHLCLAAVRKQEKPNVTQNDSVASSA